MSVRTVKGFVWLAVAIAFAMVMATASPAFDRTQSFALFFGACAVLIAAALWYRRVIPAAEAEEEQEHAGRVAMLKQELGMTGRPVAVKSSSGILLLALMSAMSLWFGRAALAVPAAGSISMFVLSLVLTFFVGLVALPLGKPVLTIMRDGVDTPTLGLLKWEEIESVGIRARTSHGVTSHVVHLYIPGLNERERQLHPLLRLRRRMVRGSSHDVLAIPLGFASHPGPVVHGLCYELWKERTGRTSMATAAPSKEIIELKRRADEQFDALKRIEATVKQDPAEAMKALEELKKRFPLTESPPPTRTRLTGRKARMEAVLNEMHKIDPRDAATRKRVLDTHMKAEVRRGTTIGVILIIVGFAAVMTVVVLLN